MKHKKILLLMSLALLLTGCGAVEQKTTQAYEGKAESDFSGKKYVTVAESGDMKLELLPTTGNLRWENKKTGEYLDTTKAETDLKDTTALSDVVAYYFDGKDSKKYTSYTAMDTHSYGFENESVTYEKMDNGVRFVYSLGSDSVSYKNFPAYITPERLQDLVLQYCDEKQQKTVMKQYRKTKSGVLARKKGKDNPLSGKAAPELYNLFYEVGHYTYEELEADCTEYDKLDELPSTQTIHMVVEYTLDNGDLVVNIPTQYLTSNEDFPMRSLDVLPYFMSSNEKDGYLFVPDGSGALLYLDNDKLAEYRYTSFYYGGDVLADTEVYDASPTSMMLPVYGMKSGDMATLGIIESGAEIAELNTYMKGYFSGIDYARASLSFYICKEQTLSSYVGSTNNFTLNKVPTDFYTGDIRLRYKFLTGDDANYSGMAKSYQKYLVDQGVLQKLEAPEKAPLFVDFLGEVDKEKYFLGVPYQSSVALTTFAQAEEILKDLSAEGAGNVLAKYEGMVNGGLNQRAVESVKVSSVLGGKKDLQSLQKTAQETGAQIFPSVQLQTACTAKHLSKKERSYTLAGSLAIRNRFDLVKREPKKDDPYKTYYIAPTYLQSYIGKFDQSYGKLGIDNLASSDFYTFFQGDYRNKANISTTTAMPEYAAGLEKLSTDYNLMLSNPAVTAYKDVDIISDLPLDNSQMKVLDAWVPFTQMVLSGHIVYGSAYINRDLEALGDSYMKAIESGSALNFRLMAGDTSVLNETTQEDVFFAEYDLWKDSIATCYEKYSTYYEKVKGASIVNHEIENRDNLHRIVTYDNGVQVYLNYGDEDAEIAGVTVPAHDYLMK